MRQHLILFCLILRDGMVLLQLSGRFTVILIIGQTAGYSLLS
ncbi:hypothetical protein KR100_01270 [Synechococcus sp. KORDI-100]|nr:hypothetical protein KR100_01270 [Synechococcus sp. KORDI-100]